METRALSGTNDVFTNYSICTVKHSVLKIIKSTSYKVKPEYL